MRAVLIVVVTPCCNQMAGMAQSWEQVLVGTFVPQAVIEALNQAVLHRLVRRGVVPHDLAVLLPFEFGVWCQLGAVVRREEVLYTGYGRALCPHIAQPVAINGFQVSTVVLH